MSTVLCTHSALFKRNSLVKGFSMVWDTFCCARVELPTSFGRGDLAVKRTLSDVIVDVFPIYKGILKGFPRSHPPAYLLSSRTSRESLKRTAQTVPAMGRAIQERNLTAMLTRTRRRSLRIKVTKGRTLMGPNVLLMTVGKMGKLRRMQNQITASINAVWNSFA